MFGAIREISGEIFNLCFFNQSMSKYARNLSKKHIMPERKLLVFDFHGGNRAHFAQIGRSLP